MMPDKIFLNKHMLRCGMLYPAQYPADTPEFEYIRKDSLLEWAKEKEQNAITNLVKLTYKTVIEKIESL